MLSFSWILLFLVGATVGYNCPPEGQHFFPHPTKCSKFIECNDGHEAVVDCFKNMIFNPNAGFCDFPSNYPCEDKPEEGPVGQCPGSNGEYVRLLADVGKCDVFYMCDWGTPIRAECPPGLHFNPKLCVCDYPRNAGCTAGK